MLNEDIIMKISNKSLDVPPTFLPASKLIALFSSFIKCNEEEQKLKEKPKSTEGFRFVAR